MEAPSNSTGPGLGLVQGLFYSIIEGDPAQCVSGSVYWQGFLSLNPMDPAQLKNLPASLPSTLLGMANTVALS